MEPKQFTDSSAGRVIQVGKGEGAYWAFVPDSLPPEIDFDPKLVKVLADANLALGELAGLGRTILNPNLLINPFIRREAVLSSKIEGTQTQIEHLYAYEAGQLDIPGFEPSPLEPDVQEVVNYVNAMKYGLDRLQKFPLSKRFIREIHKILMQGVRDQNKTPGEFRRWQNWIGSSGDTPTRAAFVSPPVEEMKAALDEFEKYLYEKDDPYPLLVRLACIHYQFEAMHPFLDGNGRIGRLLITLLLVQWELLPQPLLYLSAYFEKHHQKYYQHLMKISTQGAWREWLIFFLKGVKEQSQDAISRAKALQDLQLYWRERCRQSYRSINVLKAIDLFFFTPLWTITDMQKVLAVDFKSAQRSIESLEKEGFVREITGKKYRKIYAAEEVLNVISKK